MIYKATREIAERFKAEDLRFDIEEGDTSSSVTIFGGLDNTSIRIQYISYDDDNDVSIRVYRFAQVPEDRNAAAFLAVNKLNERFRYVNFVFDTKDRSVDIHIDLPLTTVNVGDTALEMLHRLASICDDAYPDLMRALWRE